MLRKGLALSTVFLLVGLLLPQGVSANKTEKFLGSLTIAGASSPICPAPAPVSDLFGIVVLSNPGLEKTIVNHIPPLVHPIFIDVDKKDSGEVLEKRLDTHVVVTNSNTTTCLSFTMTIRDKNGAVLAAPTVTLDPQETGLFFLENLIP